VLEWATFIMATIAAVGSVVRVHEDGFSGLSEKEWPAGI
jgi:hypothetical protein